MGIWRRSREVLSSTLGRRFDFSGNRTCVRRLGVLVCRVPIQKFVSVQGIECIAFQGLVCGIVRESREDMFSGQFGIAPRL
jgi:hypothetical protein